MRKPQWAFAGAALLAGLATNTAAAEIYNGTYNRTNDGYFFPKFFAGNVRPHATIMAGFCYNFILNGDGIDFTQSVTSQSPGVNSIQKTKVLNGAQNSVDGHAIGQITIQFCLDAATTGDKTIHIFYPFGEYDQLVVSVTKGGRWTSYTPQSARVNIPFQFTVTGTQLGGATIEGNGVRRIPDPSDINSDAQLRMTLVFDPTVGGTLGRTVLYLRRFFGGTGVAETDPGVLRTASGLAAMTVDVTGTTANTGTITTTPILSSGPAPTPSGASIDQLRLNAIGGKSLRHVAANRKIDEFFCQNFPVPATGGATERQVNVPGWGLSVSNPTSGTFSGAAALVLAGPVPAPAAVPVSSLRSGQSVAMPFSRPTSVTRAILILPSTSATIKALYGGAAALGCYQSAMLVTDPLNWVDPPFTLQLQDASHNIVHTIGF